MTFEIICLILSMVAVFFLGVSFGIGLYVPMVNDLLGMCQDYRKIIAKLLDDE